MKKTEAPADDKAIERACVLTLQWNSYPQDIVVVVVVVVAIAIRALAVACLSGTV